MPIERIGRDVAQPPSAVTTSTHPTARPAKGAYRRNLPHIQQEDKSIFVTFTTFKRWELPEPVRDLVINHCLHDHGKKLVVHGIVVMPDHVHWSSAPCGISGEIFLDWPRSCTGSRGLRLTL
jgi:hypothetical protein